MYHFDTEIRMLAAAETMAPADRILQWRRVLTAVASRATEAGYAAALSDADMRSVLATPIATAADAADAAPTPPPPPPWKDARPIMPRTAPPVDDASRAELERAARVRTSPLRARPNLRRPLPA